jgi:hypothetical protein
MVHGRESVAKEASMTLVQRLRSEAVNWSRSCGGLFDEAADEIEKLENDLEAAINAAKLALLANDLNKAKIAELQGSYRPLDMNWPT